MVEQLKRILARRSRISTQLYLAVGGAVVMTIAASLVGWFSFNRVGEVQSRVNEGSVPELAAAFEVAQYGSTLVAAAPSLTTAANPRELALVAANIDHAFLSFEEQIAVLEESESAGTERVEAIQTHAETLITNINDLKFSMAEVFLLTETRSNLQAELAELRSRLDDLLGPRHRRSTLLCPHRVRYCRRQCGVPSGPPFGRSGGPLPAAYGDAGRHQHRHRTSG